MHLKTTKATVVTGVEAAARTKRKETILQALPEPPNGPRMIRVKVMAKVKVKEKPKEMEKGKGRKGTGKANVIRQPTVGILDSQDPRVGGKDSPIGRTRKEAEKAVKVPPGQTAQGDRRRKLQ